MMMACIQKYSQKRDFSKEPLLTVLIIVQHNLNFWNSKEVDYIQKFSYACKVVNLNAKKNAKMKI